ncbi:MAG: glycosyltransferase [Saccharofermentans sp.]|nr:glycosyltransferase [Saccharofermentans sp.]
MKDGFLINASGCAKWIGGVYYKRNIAYQLIQNKYIMDNFRLIIITENSNAKEFASLKKDAKVISIPSVSYKKRQLFIKFLCKIYSIKFVYSTEQIHEEFGKAESINWIPDFQHNYYPEFFSQDELDFRNYKFSEYGKSNNSLVLSSEDCLKDFQKFYSSDKKNVYVVPFVSYIESQVRSITPNLEEDILNKYSLKKHGYACVMNQFWQHKNHKVVFEALKKYEKTYPDEEFTVVFTGLLEDYRNPEYIDNLKTLADSLGNHIKILGLISREDQIVLMKNSRYVIQPSLFEGWGTVVEDAKVLDKTILLSNIPVHVEQKNDKCVLFDPHNSEELMLLMHEYNSKVPNDNIEIGISNMQKNALIYSSGFEKLIKNRNGD